MGGLDRQRPSRMLPARFRTFGSLARRNFPSLGRSPTAFSRLAPAVISIDNRAVSLANAVVGAAAVPGRCMSQRGKIRSAGIQPTFTSVGSAEGAPQRGHRRGFSLPQT
jgi:hypothetical protein